MRTVLTRAPAREDQPAAPPPDAASPRAAGTRRQNPGTAAGPAHAGPAHDDDPEPPQAPATNSDLAIALHHMSGQEFTSFLTMGETPRHGSRGWRRDGLQMRARPRTWTSIPAGSASRSAPADSAGTGRSPGRRSAAGSMPG